MIVDLLLKIIIFLIVNQKFMEKMSLRSSVLGTPTEFPTTLQGQQDLWDNIKPFIEVIKPRKNETEQAIIEAKNSGFVIGAKVSTYIGEGHIARYNKSCSGWYSGDEYPVYVQYSEGEPTLHKLCVLTLVKNQ